jgi:hypothetical protein
VAGAVARGLAATARRQGLTGGTAVRRTVALTRTYECIMEESTHATDLAHPYYGPTARSYYGSCMRRPPPAGAVVLDFVLPAALDADPPPGVTPPGVTPASGEPALSGDPAPREAIREAAFQPHLLRSFCERPTGKEPTPWPEHACVLRLEELVAFLQAAAAYLTPADPPNFPGFRSIAQSLKGARACCTWP